MTILKYSKFTAQVELDGAEVFDTEIEFTGQPVRKYFLTHFTGAGNLEVSGNGTDFLNTTETENSIIELATTSSKFLRINAAGTKVLNLITLD